MQKKIIWFCLIIVLCCLASGCGTIVYGSRQDLAINTTPSGVKATIEDQSCVTPCTLNIPRKSEKVIFSYGQETKKYRLVRVDNVGPYYFGNVAFGVVPGWIGDSIMGGRYSIEPVNIILPKSKEQNSNNSAGIPIR